MKKIIILIFFSPLLSIGQKELNVQIDSSIQKGINWLQNNPDSLSYDIYLFYGYIQRKFGVSPIGGLENAVKKLKDEKLTFRAFERLINPEVKFDASDIWKLGAVDQLTAQAVWCDKIPIKDEDAFLDLLELNLAKSFRKRSHAYFTCQFIRENKHRIRKTKKFKSIENQAREKLVEFIGNQFNITDKKLEAMAYLMFTDKNQELITPELIQEVIGAQNSDGGWDYSFNREVVEPHTVLVAIWVLLEYRYPEAKETGWIAKI